MALEIYPWCGDETKRSSKFTLNVNPAGANTPVHVYGSTRVTVPNDTLAWDGGDSVETSFATIGRTETFTLRVTRVGADIDSIVVYPRRYRSLVNATLVDNGGTQVADLNIPDDGVPFLYIEVNGARMEMLMLKFNPLEPATPGGATIYDGSQTQVIDGEVIVFEPGVHDMTDPDEPGVAPRFACENGSRVIIKGGAYVIGNFDVTQVLFGGAGDVEDISFEGAGVLSGEYADPATVQALGWEASAEYCFFYGENGNYTRRNISVSGITLTLPCYWMDRSALCHSTDVMAINPWNWGIGFFFHFVDSNTGTSTVTRCISLNHDDSFMWTYAISGHRTCTDDYSVTANGSPFDHGFSPYEDITPLSLTRVRCGAMMLGSWAHAVAQGYTGALRRFHCAAKLWVDGTDAQETWKTMPVTETTFHVDGPCKVAILQLENLPDPFTGGNDGAGQIQGYASEGLDCEQTPDLSPLTNKPIRIWGRDATSTPHDITLANWVIGGVPVTSANFSTFADVNSFPYNITILPEGAGGPPRIVSIAIEPTSPHTGIPGGTQQFTAIATYDDSTTADVTGEVAWSTSTPLLVNLEGGLATAIAAGLASITATYEDPDAPIVATVSWEIMTEMAPFTVEDGTGLEAANALATVEFVDAWALENQNPTSWSEATPSEKEDAIRSASRWVSLKRKFNGQKIKQTQALAFPRYGLLDEDGWSVDYTSVPRQVQQAVAIVAIKINDGTFAPFPDEAQQTTGKTSTSVSVGPITISDSFADTQTSQSTEVRLPLVERLLAPFFAGTKWTLGRG